MRGQQEHKRIVRVTTRSTSTSSWRIMAHHLQFSNTSAGKSAAATARKAVLSTSVHRPLDSKTSVRNYLAASTIVSRHRCPCWGGGS